MTLPFAPPQRAKQSAPSASRLPKDVEPSALLLRILDTARPHEVVPWVRKGEDGKPLGEFVMQVLTDYETTCAIGDAERFVRDLLKRANDGDSAAAKEVNQEAWRDAYESAMTVELLFRACRKQEDVRHHLFRSPADIREYLTRDEIAELAGHYDRIQYTHGPLFRFLTDEEVDWWIDTLARGAEAIPFGQLSRGQLVQLIVSLGSRLSSLQTGTSSPGPGSADGSSDTSGTSNEPSESNESAS